MRFKKGIKDLEELSCFMGETLQVKEFFLPYGMVLDTGVESHPERPDSYPKGYRLNSYSLHILQLVL